MKIDPKIKALLRERASLEKYMNEGNRKERRSAGKALLKLDRKLDLIFKSKNKERKD